VDIKTCRKKTSSSKKPKSSTDALSSLFIADLHLKADAPALTASAHRLLQQLAPRFENLFILGDLVEYWLGDDADDGSQASVFNALRALSDQGVSIRMMPGNRDFLFGQAFAARIGAELIQDDEIVFEDEDHRLLLLHGDTLCTDDVPYQQLRRMLRDPHWQADFLSKPIAERIAAAAQLREKSRQETHAKSAEIMDVNADSVIAVMEQYGVYDMIHGHTHRPDTHEFQINDHQARRTVLGDWRDEGARIAVLENGQLSLLQWPQDFADLD
jgi:UDP-2,3-diacylglucosamine hydrolase